MRKLDAGDRWAIVEPLSLHGHFSTGARWTGLRRSSPRRSFTTSGVRGAGTFEGIEAVRNGALKLGAGNPVAHHVRNIGMASEEDDLVTVRSKGLMSGACIAGEAGQS